MEIHFDLETDEVVLTTDFSHRAFAAKRAFCCRECGTTNKNPLVEVLRAVAIYEKSIKTERDVSRAVLAYDLEEILKRSGDKFKGKVLHLPSRGRSYGNGVTGKVIPSKMTIEDLGDLE